MAETLILKKEFLGRLRQPFLDSWDRLRGQCHPLTPPRHLIPFGIHRLREHGLMSRILAQDVKESCKLQPNERILDVGCGTGRLAIGLLDFLGPEGRYVGFDIDEKRIRWCRQNITRRNPLFSFVYSNVSNPYYRRDANLRPETYRFPWADNSFDVVALISVFTHMLPHEAENYLKEIVRVLKPGGRCFISYYLVTDEALSFLRDPERNLTFPELRNFLRFDYGEYRTAQPMMPEMAVGLMEPWVRTRYAQVGLRIAEPIRYGHWSGRQTPESRDNLQDYVVGLKN